MTALPDGLGIAISFRRERRRSTRMCPMTKKHEEVIVNVLEWIRIEHPRDSKDIGAFRLLARDYVGKDADACGAFFRAHREGGSPLWRPRAGR